jgi:hypothetical protein
VRDQIFNSDPVFDARSNDELLRNLVVGPISHRARAAAVLGRRAASDPSLRVAVLTAIEDPALRGRRVMGTISLSHIAFACLLEHGDDAVRDALLSRLSAWPEQDRGDLLWFLRSQDIAIENA